MLLDHLHAMASHFDRVEATVKNLIERGQQKWGLQARGANKSRDVEGNVSRKVKIISEMCQQK